MLVKGMLIIRQQIIHLRKYQRALRVHQARLWKVYGCIECAREQFPGQRLVVCGKCTEEFTYCEQCYNRGEFVNSKAVGTHLPSHPLFIERIVWEVNPNLISTARSLRAFVRMCFRVYAQRDCLGQRTPPNLTYNWFNYADVYARVAMMIRAWDQLNIKRRAMICICLSSVPAFYISQYACFLGDRIACPLPSSTSLRHLIHLLSSSFPFPFLFPFLCLPLPIIIIIIHISGEG